MSEHPRPPDGTPAAQAFDAGVTHALDLLGKAFGVSEITIWNGSEEYDGDVHATIWGIIREGVGDDVADDLILKTRERPKLTLVSDR